MTNTFETNQLNSFFKGYLKLKEIYFIFKALLKFFCNFKSSFLLKLNLCSSVNKKGARLLECIKQIYEKIIGLL